MVDMIRLCVKRMEICNEKKALRREKENGWREAWNEKRLLGEGEGGSEVLCIPSPSGPTYTTYTPYLHAFYRNLPHQTGRLNGHPTR